MNLIPNRPPLPFKAPAKLGCDRAKTPLLSEYDRIGAAIWAESLRAVAAATADVLGLPKKNMSGAVASRVGPSTGFARREKNPSTPVRAR